AVAAAALVGVWGEAGEGGGLLAAESAELGHEREEGGGDDGAEAFDRAQGDDGALEGLTDIDQPLDRGLDGTDLLVEGLADRVDEAGDRAGSLAPVAPSGAGGDHIVASEHEGAELCAILVDRLPAGELAMPILAIAGKGAGIDRVVLAQGSERTDVSLHLAGIGAMGGAAGRIDRVEQRGLVAAGRFADHQRVRLETGSEGSKYRRLVGEAGDCSATAVEDNDLLLADIAADERGRQGGDGCH